MVEGEYLENLVKEVQEDMSRFDELYDYAVNTVYFWCYEAVGNKDTAKDLAQESMVRIARYLHTLDDPAMFRGWSYVVSKNICKSYHSKKQTVDKVLEVDEQVYDDIVYNIEDDSEEYRPEEKFKEKERDALVVDFVNGLPQKQKEAIILYYLEEFSINEIAQMLNTRTPNVKTNLFLGRKNLEKQISEYQKSNNVRLYDMSIFLVLGGVLAGYKEYVCKGVELPFRRAAFTAAVNAVPEGGALTASSIGTTTIGGWISTHIVTLIVGAVIASTVVGAVLLNNNGGGTNQIPIDGTGLVVDKSKNSVIESAVIENEVIDGRVSITVQLGKDVSSKDISIQYNETTIPFEYDNRKINLKVSENGKYHIKVNEDIGNFVVTSIEHTLPIVNGYTKLNGAIQFDIPGDASLIDYEKSYMLFDGKEYKLTSDNKVNGNFSGEISLYIYSKTNQFASYNFTVD